MDSRLIVAAENDLKNVLELTGLEFTSANLKDTPKRIAKMWLSEDGVFSSLHKPIEELEKEMTLFPAKSHDTVVVKDIPFNSMCAHHFLPFFGKVDVSYIPEKEIIGLSKIPRVVHYFSKMPQVQEEYTQSIGEFLVKVISPRFLSVDVHDTLHTCVKCRGIETYASMDTHFEYNKDSD